MPHTVTNRGKALLAENDVTALDIRTLVITDAATLPAASTIEDWNTVADVLATMTEAAVANYAREDRAAAVVTEDDTNNRAYAEIAAWTMSPGPATGETWQAQVHYVEGASDAARDVISVEEPASPLTTDGNNVDFSATRWNLD